MALMHSAGRKRAGSTATVAVLVARLTLARATPSVAASVRSMVRAQAAQVMPETGRSMRSAVFIVGRTPWSARDAVVPPPEARRQPPAKRPPSHSCHLLSSRYLVAQLPHRNEDRRAH